MARTKVCAKSIKAYLLFGVFASLIALNFYIADWPGFCIDRQDCAPTWLVKTKQIETECPQLSADTGDVHNYAKHEDGHYRITQIARGQSARCFKTLHALLTTRNISLLLQIKLAALPSSLIAEQQRSIPVFLRRLLI